METKTFYNQFGAYTVPLDVYIDPTSVTSFVAPSYEASSFVGYANVNNALSFQRWQLAADQAKQTGSALPQTPNYWKVAGVAIDAYWNALTKGGTGFDSNVQPGEYGLPAGVGGSFVR